MTDDVARALCEAAGRSVHEDRLTAVCPMCDRQPNGSLVCSLWPSFRAEARAAIQAAYRWQQRERRWPGFVKGT